MVGFQGLAGSVGNVWRNVETARKMGLASQAARWVMQSDRYMGNTVWGPKSQQNAKALRSFKDAMNDIGDVVDFEAGPGLSVEYIRNAGRKVSVALRKLILDGAPLIHRVLQGPRFEPLRDRGGLTGDVYENSFSMQIAPGTEDGRLLAPAAERAWSVTVHPLHGLRFDSRTKLWHFERLFDAQAKPLALGTWLNQRLFTVDQRAYSLGDTLKFVANKKAAHVDIDRDEQSRDMERVHFGHTTYPQLVAVLVASYLLERYQASRIKNAELWGRFLGVSGETDPAYRMIGGGEFRADIDRPGFQGEFHETGIQLAGPGRVWKPIKIREDATVRA